jgi:outer membrane immunogenic protein
MRKLAVLAVLATSLTAFGATVRAADIADPVYDWSGLYAGVHAGYLWGNVDVEENGAPAADGDIEGFVGGALAGFNFQHDIFVLGAEADFGWSSADGSGAIAPPAVDYDYDLDWNAHLRGRVGLAADNFLFFVAGGLALSEFHVREVGAPVDIGKTYTGFSIGGGIEYAATENLLLRVEYLHDEFGRESYTVGADSYSADLDTDTVRAALIYKFNPY